jgi:hypothetical protein
LKTIVEASAPVDWERGDRAAAGPSAAAARLGGGLRRVAARPR